MIKDNEKLGHLEIELNQVSEKRSIVFVNTKKSCDIVSRRLDELGYACTVLHGSKTQVTLVPFYSIVVSFMTPFQSYFCSCHTMYKFLSLMKVSF